MRIRETLERHSRVVTGVAGAAVLVAVGIVVWQVRANAGGVAQSDRSYYTVDDGKTWFADAADKVPPFEHEGKQAVRCSVYNVNGKDTVTFLLKYPDDVQKAMLKDRADAKARPAGEGEAASSMGIKYAHAGVVKRPGDATWYPMSDAKAQALTQPPPDGIPVTPE